MLPLRSEARKDHWIRCTGCGHKLGRIIKPAKTGGTIEIKCHSCKTINVYQIKFKEDK